MWFVLTVAPGQFKYPAVQRYLHDLSTDLAEHIESITSALSLFINVGKSFRFTPMLTLGLPDHHVLGIPTIESAQGHGAQNLLNLSAVATFFSSVTATSLQFSFNNTNDFAANAVNAFWFTSLVFSIGEFMSCIPKVPFADHTFQPLLSTVFWGWLGNGRCSMSTHYLSVRFALMPHFQPLATPPRPVVG